jgi:hypothetical protein
MKVATTKAKVVGIPDKVKEACYKVYDDDAKLKKDMENQNNGWFSRQFEVTLDEVGQKAYQDFVSGFLYYYDTELRNGSIDHTVHFKWEQRQTAQGNVNFVTVYLNPPARLTPTHPDFKPGQANLPGADGSITDPPSPTGPPPPPPR